MPNTNYDFFSLSILKLCSIFGNLDLDETSEAGVRGSKVIAEGVSGTAFTSDRIRLPLLASD